MEVSNDDSIDKKEGLKSGLSTVSLQDEARDRTDRVEESVGLTSLVELE